MIKPFYEKDFVVCKYTSKSNKPKPIKGQNYIVHKRVTTSWGDKIILSSIDGEEIWGDPSYLEYVPSSELSQEAIRNLNEGYEKFLDKIHTPAIVTVINKNGAGIEVVFSSGHRNFLSKKIIRNVESFNNSKLNETISIEIPVWYAKKYNIIKSSED